MKVKTDKKLGLVIINPDGNYRLAIDKKGDVLVYDSVYCPLKVDKDGNDTEELDPQRALTAAQLAALAERSAMLAKCGDAPTDTDGGEEIEYEEDGGVNVGCQSFDAKTVAAIAALSRKVRGRK